MSRHVSECKASFAVQILNDQEARFNSADLNIAYKMNVDEYQKLCPYSGELEANWGKAPGNCPAPTILVPAWLLSLHCPVLRWLQHAVLCCSMQWLQSYAKQVTWHALMHCSTVSRQQSSQRLLKQN